jgi:hypothetical protein
MRNCTHNMRGVGKRLQLILFIIIFCVSTFFEVKQFFGKIVAAHYVLCSLILMK